jgi:hypothetical protein
VVFIRIKKMKPGPKPKPPSLKKAQGTLRPCREVGTTEIIAPNDLPQKPHWLTVEGEEFWIDDMPRAFANQLLSERDVTMFANYCNLQGEVTRMWLNLRSGHPEAVAPTPSLINQITKMQEYFGIAGAKSRVVKVEQSGSVGNAFNRFKR